MASFAIEDFGSERLERLTMDEIEDRFAEFKRMTTSSPWACSRGPQLTR